MAAPHRHANELQRISDVNPHVNFIDAQGNMPERFVTHELLNVTSAWISACFGSLNSRNFRCTPQLCKSIPREEGSEPVRRRRATEDFVHVSLAFHRRGTLESRSLDSDGQATPVTLAPSLASFASTSLTALPPERGLFSAVFSSVAFFPPVHFHFFLPPLTVALVLIRATAAALALVAAVHCAPLVPDGVGTDLTNATIESIPYNATNTETTPITGNDPYDGTNYTLAAPYTPAGGDQQRKPTYRVQSNFDFQSLMRWPSSVIPTLHRRR